VPSKGLRSERDSGVPVGFQALTVSTNAVALTIPAGMVTYAWIEVQDQPIRVRVDGTAPTATVGHYYVPGQTDVLNEQELRRLQAIRDTAAGSDATLLITYYKS
jgi:hypothetical protein